MVAVEYSLFWVYAHSNDFCWYTCSILGYIAMVCKNFEGAMQLHVLYIQEPGLIKSGEKDPQSIIVKLCNIGRTLVLRVLNASFQGFHCRHEAWWQSLVKSYWVSVVDNKRRLTSMSSFIYKEWRHQEWPQILKLERALTRLAGAKPRNNATSAQVKYDLIDFTKGSCMGSVEQASGSKRVLEGHKLRD